MLGLDPSTQVLWVLGSSPRTTAREPSVGDAPLAKVLLAALLASSNPALAAPFQTYSEHITSGIQEENLDIHPLGAAETSTARILLRIGLELIKDYEGWIPNAYNDASNYCTVGYGHLVARQPCYRVVEQLTRFDLPLSVDTGLLVLDGDTRLARVAVQQLISVNLNDEQFGALVSFVFNVGSDKFASSTLLKFVNNGEFDEAISQFGRWVKSKGVVLSGLASRRACEAALFTGALSLRSDGKFYRDDCATLGAAPSSESLLDIEFGETHK